MTGWDFMTAPFVHICHSLTGHPAALMMAGGTVGCVLHCVGTCALCLTGGTVAGASFYTASQMFISRLAPALLAFTTPILLLSRSSI